MQDNYEFLLKKRRDWYFKLGSRFYECVNADVVFDASGFRHLTYNGYGNPRNKSDQLRRLHLITHAPTVLEIGSMMQRNRNGDLFYAVSAKVKGINITVILKDLQKYLLFWSVQ
ncbi:MAG: hypothetical protein WCV82_00165 [Candidatus Paceibacterota bacterium]